MIPSIAPKSAAFVPPIDPNQSINVWFNAATGLPTTKNISVETNNVPNTGYTQKLTNPANVPFAGIYFLNNLIV